MANPVLGKLQGQGLIETTTSGLQQTGAQLAVTPVGAAMQGRGPDSQKMAGTQPAKINAAAANMRDVTSAALGTLRETSRIMEGQQDEIAQVAANAEPLARADKAISSAAQAIINSTFASFKWEGANLDATKLKNAGFKDTDIAALSQALADLISGGPNLTQSDIDVINNALEKTGGTKISLYDKEQPVSAFSLATSLGSLYADDSSTSLPKILANAIKDAESSTQISNLNLTTLNTILGKEYTPDQLAQARAEFVTIVKSVTGLDDAAIGQLNFRSLRAAIDKWQKDEFKDVADLRATLADPTASTAQRQLAIQELRRLGQIGVTGAEAKVNDIQAQMDDEDTIKLGNEEFTVEELFSDPAKLMQIQTWVDNPETAPPELKTWLEQNQNGIQLQIQKLMGEGSAGIFGAVAAIQGVANNLKTDPSIGGVNENVMENLFPEFADLSLDSKIPVDPATLGADVSAADKQKAQESWDNYQKYSLLKTPLPGQPNTAIAANNLYNGLLTKAGIDGKAIFKELTLDQIKTIVSSETRVNDFLDGLKNRVFAGNFKGDVKNPESYKNEFKLLAKDLGFQTTGEQLANLLNANLTDYVSLFKDAGLGDWLKTTSRVGSKGPFSDAVGPNAISVFNIEKLTSLITQVKNMSLSDLISGKNREIIDSISKITLKLENVPPPTQKVVSVNDFFSLGQNPDSFNLAGLSPELSQERAEFKREVGYHPDGLIRYREQLSDNENKTVQSELARLKSEGWEVDIFSDTSRGLTYNGSKISSLYAMVKRDGNGKIIQMLEPTDPALKTLNDAHYRQTAHKKEISNIISDRTTLEKNYVDRLNKFVNKKNQAYTTQYNSSLTLYNNFNKLFKGLS